MATIKLKNGSGAPLASDLVQGEPALDLTNKRLYTEDTLGAVIEVGVNPSELTIGGTLLTASATELNTLDGITATTAELNIMDGVTASALELNVLDGITTTTAELNTLDGVTATFAEINTLDGITASTAELNILDGVTATAADLNVLAGTTLTSTDLPYFDKADNTSGQVEDSKVVIADNTGSIEMRDGGALSWNNNNLVIRNAYNSSSTFDASYPVKFEGEKWTFRQQDFTEMAVFEAGGVDLKKDGTSRLTTTSTGIDVTGTVKSDDALIAVSSGYANLYFNDDSSSSARYATIGKNYDSPFDLKLTASNSASSVPIIFNTSSSSEAMRIDSSGNVGVGTDSPASPLAVMAESVSTVPAAGADSSHFAVGKNDQYGTMIGTLGSGDGYIQQQRFDGTTTTYDLFVQPNGGNVGIGTSTPDTLLELVGDDPILTIRDSATGSATANATLRLAETGASDTLDAYWDIKAVGGDLQFIDNWNEGGGTGTRLVIDDIGNVGIGTDLPTSQLHLASTASTVTFEDTNSTNNSINTINSYEGTMIFNVDLNNNSTVSESMRFTMLGSEAMRIDSVGRVGIGTASPASVLHLFNSSTASSSLSEGLTLSSNAASENDRLPAITWDYGTTGTPTFAAVDASRSSGTGGNLLFHTATTGGTLTEAMRIDSDGNVGIGTDSPAAKLHVYQSANNIIQVGSAGTSTAGIDLAGDGATAGTDSYRLYQDSGKTAYVWNYANTPLRIGTNNDEAMRIDSSGNLLVGKTSASSSTDGAELKDGDGVSAIIGTSNQSNAASGNVMILNRRTTDGEIVDFRKDGASVGSIGAAGSRVYISGPSSSLHSGLIFTDNGSEGIIAPSTNAGAVANGTTDLGYSGGRFKDGHFSGNINANTFTAIDGLYVGGTGFANKLDDYEEGTWTPAFSITNATITHDLQNGRYTKIGNIVYFDILLGTDAATGTFSTSNMLITGLPFASSATVSGAVGINYDFATALDDPKWSITSGTTVLSLYKGNNTATQIKGDQFGTGTDNNRLYISGCYQTNS